MGGGTGLQAGVGARCPEWEWRWGLLFQRPHHPPGGQPDAGPVSALCRVPWESCLGSRACILLCRWELGAPVLPPGTTLPGFRKVHQDLSLRSRSLSLNFPISETKS